MPWATFTINQFGVEATSYVGIQHRVVETDASLAQTNITGAGDGGIELDVVDGCLSLGVSGHTLEPAIEAELERMKRADLGYRDENTGDDAGDI